MELKRKEEENVLDAKEVLLVPLWNWNNLALDLPDDLNKVLLVPLWNWNIYTDGENHAAICFTRTFMELKLECDKFKENKEEFYSYLYGIETHLYNAFLLFQVVLLVPLWNWNFGSTPMKTSWICFTRTFMELKLETDKAFCIDIQVLLVPLWNWNRLAAISTAFARTFYSYLYGIETCKHHTWKNEFQSFTRTFMELKQ